MSPTPGPRSTWSKLGWFVLLWAGGVAVITVVGFAIKLSLGV
ncbi:MAG: DUF2474 domain-containing protein [Alphaproteobacteria bacterium]|nr:DUF2474 domain-containing protein [Alphaproteobacteria bacterium]MBU0798166.1 DUF2474 domain-containing protein [Alphaproteobacteria bacterium]MBU0887615.1 DUF2474 domain-containing protein [Alphaproteobacteria bacterium]MBU1814267.1 DUF2474 domain-containing protein [Alphaproteobacteria bacterium]MBU2089268.1 DUF2474 domain-containing protein [Alphaproteobacteria bacterium]